MCRVIQSVTASLFLLKNILSSPVSTAFTLIYFVKSYPDSWMEAELSERERDREKLPEERGREVRKKSEEEEE